MSVLDKTLKIQKGDVVYEAMIYDSIDEVGDAYFTVQVDGDNCYIPLGDIDDDNALPLKINKNGMNYAVLSSSPL